MNNYLPARDSDGRLPWVKATCLNTSNPGIKTNYSIVWLTSDEHRKVYNRRKTIKIRRATTEDMELMKGHHPCYYPSES